MTPPAATWAIERKTFPLEEENALVETLRVRRVPAFEFVGPNFETDSAITSAAVPRGSCFFVLEASRWPAWREDLWGDPAWFDCSHYRLRFESFLLNRGSRSMSINEFCWTARDIAAEWNTPTLFVRPDDGFKSFAGELLEVAQVDDWRQGLALQQVGFHSTIHVAPPRRLLKEWRIQIVCGSAVAASEYRPDRRRGAPREALAFAEHVHRSAGWPVKAYAMDVAQTESGLEVVEIGCLLCTAFYRSDPGAIVDALMSALNAP